jgi:hypothetical protein
VQAAVVLVAEALDEDGPAVGDAVVVGVLEGDQVGGIRGVELAVAPGQAHRGDEALGEDGGRRAVDPPDPALADLFLELEVEVAAGAFGDVEAAAVVDAAEHGEGDVRRGDLLDGIAFGDPGVLERQQEQDREHCCIDNYTESGG